VSGQGAGGEGPAPREGPSEPSAESIWDDDDLDTDVQASKPSPAVAAASPPPDAAPATASHPVTVSAPEVTEQPEAAEAAHDRSRSGGAARRALLGAGTFFRELPGLLLLAFVLALLIKTFLIQAFYIPSGSMEHTLNIGDRVLVNKVVYHIHPPRRGDVIVFGDPHPLPQEHRNPVSAFVHWLTDGLGVSRDPNKDFIKRVIGLPGETVEMNRGVVYIDGKALDEHYLGPATSTGNFGPERVKADHLFVMGDNRGDSNDSRGTLGEIPMENVIGRAFVVIWPPSRIAILRRPHYTNVSNSSALPAIGLAATGLALTRRRRRALAGARGTA
jgi:signal peptidase I